MEATRRCLQFRKLELEQRTLFKLRRSTATGQLQDLPFELLFEVIKHFDDYRYFCCLRATSNTLRHKFGKTRSYECIDILLDFYPFPLSSKIQSHICRMLHINEYFVVRNRANLKKAFQLPARVVDDMIGMASVLEELSDQLARSHFEYRVKMVELSREFKCFTHNFAHVQELNARTVKDFCLRNLVWNELEILLEESGVAFRPIKRFGRTLTVEEPDDDQKRVDSLCAQILNYRRVDLKLHFEF